MKNGRYTAVVLAAGLSSRMEEFKPLLPLGEETITDHVISIFATNSIKVILVTGWRKDELAAGIKRRDITIIENPDYINGMFSSIQAGVKSLSPSQQAFFIMPVDIPLVRPATIRRLVDIAPEYPNRIIYPTFDGVRGHPPLIPMSLVYEIMNWNKEGGLKAVLDFHPDLATEIRVPDGCILQDMDDREDYSVLLERFSKYDLPTKQECEAILDLAGTGANVRRHCEEVARVALEIARALVSAGTPVDVEIVNAAAILHDIGKGNSDHELVGEKILVDAGFRRVGNIIAAHTGFDDNADSSIETKVVLLADKYIRDVEPVTIEERYRTAGIKYASVTGIEDKIRRGREHALGIKEELTRLLGYSPDSIIFK